MARANCICVGVGMGVLVVLGLFFDVFPFVVEVFETAYEGVGQYGVYGLYVFDDGECFSNHHEYAEVCSDPLCGSDDAAVYGEVGEDVGKNKQEDVDDDLFAEFGEEEFAGCIFI